MANFAPVFKNASGRLERLLPADGGLEIDVIDCATAASAVNLFATVNNTGSLALFGAFNAAANVGALGSTFAFLGSVTVATNLTVTGNGVINGNVDLGNAAGDTVSVVGSVDSNIVFENAAPRAISIASQNLTITTTTAGILALTGATEVEVNSLLVDVNSTGAITMDAVTASQLVVSGAAADLTLGARAVTITLNEAGNTTLSALFTATSLIGCLNEIKTANAGNSTPDFLASAVITAGQVVCLDWDAGNGRCGVYVADNTVAGRQNPVGVAINSAAIGNPVYIATQGQNAIVASVIAANSEGEPVYLTTAGLVTLVAAESPPLAAGDTSQVIGTVSKAGIAGVAEIIVQLCEIIPL